MMIGHGSCYTQCTSCLHTNYEGIWNMLGILQMFMGKLVGHLMSMAMRWTHQAKGYINGNKFS